MFRRMRNLEQSNLQLQSNGSIVSSQLAQMKALLADERSKVTLLQIEIDKVTDAAEALRGVMTTPGDEQNDGEREKARDVKSRLYPSLSNWVVEGVAEIFSKFDKDNDGGLNVREMNTLQVALGNKERYSNETLFALCQANDVEFSPKGQVTLDGLLTLYNRLGPEATARDLTKLGVRVGPLLYPRRALEHAALRLVNARENLQLAKQDRESLSAELKKQTYLSTSMRDDLTRYKEQYDVGRAELEEMRARLSQAESEAASERAGRLYAEKRVQETENELERVRNACKDMHNLLKLKINEKETFQRALWSVEQKAEIMRDMSRKSREAEFREKRRQEELMKANMLMHTRTVDERRRLKEERKKVRELQNRKPHHQAFGYTVKRGF